MKLILSFSGKVEIEASSSAAAANESDSVELLIKEDELLFI